MIANTYDPTYSVTFDSILRGANVDDPAEIDWSKHLAAAAPLMDDDIREFLGLSDWGDRKNPKLDFLLAYMGAHVQKFGSHFEWA